MWGKQTSCFQLLLTFEATQHTQVANVCERGVEEGGKERVSESESECSASQHSAYVLWFALARPATTFAFGWTTKFVTSATEYRGSTLWVHHILINKLITGALPPAQNFLLVCLYSQELDVDIVN